MIDASVRFFGERAYAGLKDRYGWGSPRTGFMDDLGQLMTENGIECAVLVSELDGGVEEHAELMAINGRCQDFSVVPRIDIYRDSARDELRHYASMGVRAVRLSALGLHPDPLVPIRLEAIDSFLLWETLGELGLAVFVRPSVGDAHLLPSLLNEFSRVNVIIEASMVAIAPKTASIDRWGRPKLNLPLPTADRFTLGGICDMPNVTVVLSSQYSFSSVDWPYADLQGWHRPANLVSLFGADRLMWGSDYPLTAINPGYARCREYLASSASGVDAEDAMQIMLRTPLFLFRRPDDTR